MAPGGIPWFDLATTRGKIPRQDCQHLSPLFFIMLNDIEKLSKIVFPKPQPPHWSRLRGVKAAGESHFRRFHEPLVGRTDSGR